MPHPLFPTDGNRQYVGSGIMRYCPLCAAHRATGGGSMRHVMGLRTWVCKKHTKEKTK
jgi:hypothetical protein